MLHVPQASGLGPQPGGRRSGNGRKSWHAHDKGWPATQSAVRAPPLLRRFSYSFLSPLPLLLARLQPGPSTYFWRTWWGGQQRWQRSAAPRCSPPRTCERVAAAVALAGTAAGAQGAPARGNTPHPDPFCTPLHRSLTIHPHPPPLTCSKAHIQGEVTLDFLKDLVEAVPDLPPPGSEPAKPQRQKRQRCVEGRRAGGGGSGGHLWDCHVVMHAAPARSGAWCIKHVLRFPICATVHAGPRAPLTATRTRASPRPGPAARAAAAAAAARAAVCAARRAPPVQVGARLVAALPRGL